MTWVAVAVVGAGVVGAVGSNMAAGKQAAGQRAAAQTQADMFNTITQQEQPFIQGGYGAESELLNGLGISSPTPAASLSSGGGTPLNQIVNLGGGAYGIGGLNARIPMPAASNAAPTTSSTGAPTPTGGLPSGFFTQTFNPTQQQLEQYPGYQFQLGQGDLALQSAQSVGGSALSGPALKSLMGFNQGLAASNYSNYFNQFQTQQNNIFNRLNTIATMGQNAAGNLGTAGTQLGTGIAQAQAGAAASQAAGIVGATNSIGNSVGLAGLMRGGGSDPYASDPYSFSLGGGGSVTSDPGYGGGGT